LVVVVVVAVVVAAATAKVREAGLASTFPTRSVARTWKV